MQISINIVNGPKNNNYSRFRGILRYRLHPETISPSFANLLSTTHV